MRERLGPSRVTFAPSPPRTCYFSTSDSSDVRRIQPNRPAAGPSTVPTSAYTAYLYSRGAVIPAPTSGSATYAARPSLRRRNAIVTRRRANSGERPARGGPQGEEDKEEDSEMANHVRECLAEFNTGLDKLLGAIKEVENNSQLTPSDRDTLLRVLESALSQGKRRLLQAETVGSTPRTSDATSRRTSDESDTASIYQRTSAPAPTSTPSIDLNFLNQHGAQLIELLKQNMAKQN